MAPKDKNALSLSFNIAEHCNLNCQMCDHFAQLAEPDFLDIDSYTRDIKRMAFLTGGELGFIALIGGEPLLNDNLIEYMKIAREHFPNSIIKVITNGLLLFQWENNKNGNLWEALNKYKIILTITVYPIDIDVERIKNLADKYGVYIEWYNAHGNSEALKISYKLPLLVDRSAPKHHFINCYYFNSHCFVLKDGKIYNCPYISNIGHFNKYFNQNLVVTEHDYIDIYDAKNYDEIATFLSKKPDFCDYCDVYNQRYFDWKQSNFTVDEYLDGFEPSVRTSKSQS